jgi:hypothetical protein
MHYHERIIAWFKLISNCLGRYVLFLINSFKTKSEPIDYTEYEWILVNDHSGHCENFLHGIIKNFSKTNHILYISINPKLTINEKEISKQINEFKNFSLISLYEAIKYSRTKRSDFHKFGIWRLPIFLNYIFESARIIEACKFYDKVKLSANTKLITLCDAHWHQSVLTNQFNDRGLETITMIHGQPSAWHLLCPFISKYILSWGNRMSEMVLKYSNNITEDQIIQIGNTKYHEPLDPFQITNYSYDQLNEVVFISPGYDCSATYGYESLKNEILLFINLDLPNFTLSIRPRPFNGEEKFIRKIISNQGLSNKIKILSKGDFSSLVTKKRIFVGSISSAIADVFILNGLFVGLQEEFQPNVLETMVTYSPEMYFDIDELRNFIISLREQNFFEAYLKKINKIRDDLIIQVPQKIDIFLDDSMTT